MFAENTHTFATCYALSTPGTRAWQDHESILDDVRTKRLREETIAEKLRVHVEQCDATAALETVHASGSMRPRQELFVGPLDDEAPRLQELHHPHFVLRLHEHAVFSR